MTGPEHYREAERLLNIIMDPPRSYLEALNDDPAALGHDIALAQAHATLALAAASADGARQRYWGGEASDRAWAEAVS